MTRRTKRIIEAIIVTAAVIIVVAWVYSALVNLLTPSPMVRELTITESAMTLKNFGSAVMGRAQARPGFTRTECVVVKFYDAGGNLMHEDNDCMWLHSEEIGEFYVECLEGQASSYEITSSDTLEILDSEMIPELRWAYSEVTGIAKNTGNTALGQVQVIVRFYDSQGYLIHQGSYDIPGLDPGKTVKFSVSCPRGVLAQSYTALWED